MKKFKVWDVLNASEENAEDIEAADAERAAEKYAEEDHDGQADGIYAHQHGHALRVRDETGAAFEVMVAIDYVTHFEARRRRPV